MDAFMVRYFDRTRTVFAGDKAIDEHLGDGKTPSPTGSTLRLRTRECGVPSASLATASSLHLATQFSSSPMVEPALCLSRDRA
ncbi:MAG: hypothetical protein JWQ44_116 [Chthoniobacter sp.]|nr:hypothetical protein [Chthoniobacter sp.]